MITLPNIKHKMLYNIKMLYNTKHSKYCMNFDFYALINVTVAAFLVIPAEKCSFDAILLISLSKLNL